jgi:hypothetical protein
MGCVCECLSDKVVFNSCRQKNGFLILPMRVGRLRLPKEEAHIPALFPLVLLLYFHYFWVSSLAYNMDH